MKAFEKRYRKEILPYIHNPEDKVIIKAGWKAACEHWLQIAKDRDQEMQFLIEDELEN